MGSFRFLDGAPAPGTDGVDLTTLRGRTHPGELLSGAGDQLPRSSLAATAIGSGSLPDLLLPDFSDYRKRVEKFYEFNGYSLWWVKRMEPTAQAREAIAVMLQAGQKGVSADDYDGPRWSRRLAKLSPVTRQPRRMP